MQRTGGEMAKSPAETKNYTPQQIDFAMRYYIPTSKTYGNAYASATAAGYTEKTAKNITAQDFQWFEKIQLDIIGKPTDKVNLVAKAKKVLAETLDGDDKRLAQDTAKFVAKTDIEFSEKHDVMSGGEQLKTALVRFVGGGED
jgi:phage terminase small subunit